MAGLSMSTTHYLIKGGQIYQAAKAMKEAGYKQCQINKWSIRAYPDWRNVPEMKDRERQSFFGSPPVWEIAKKLDIYAGCGNSHQAQSNIKDLPLDIEGFKYPEWLEGDCFKGGIIIDLESDEHERIQLDETIVNLLYR